MICIILKEWGILKKKLKNVLISSKKKNQVIFFFIYIYIYFSFHEVGNISPMVLFPRRGKQFNDLNHFQKVKNTS